MKRLTDGIAGLKTELQLLLTADGRENDLPASFRDYATYREFLKDLALMNDSAELRLKIVQALVDRIDVLPESYVIHFYVGKSWIAGALKNKKALGYMPGADGSLNHLLKMGSNSLTNGWPARD